MTGGAQAATGRDAETHLAPCASRSAVSRGRLHPEEDHPYRSRYVRDRDRVIHSTSFRRLEYKTQVFVNHEGDHYRTRLTHTIEVAQISRTVARALALNEDLAEAIALSHDLGHPPFGHSGERALHELMEPHGGFEHNAHALRVVDHIEHRYPGFRGLNLTWETREAISKHAKNRHDPAFAEWAAYRYPSLEAQLVDLADGIAYLSHDLDDGVESGLLSMEQLEANDLWRAPYRAGVERGLTGKRLKYQVIRTVINDQVSDLIGRTAANIERLAIASPDDARTAPEAAAAFSPEMGERHYALKRYLREHMYRSHRVVRMEEKAYRVVRDLFTAYCGEPRVLPEAVRAKVADHGLQRIVCDYIAGMTDRFALEEHAKLFNPLSRV